MFKLVASDLVMPLEQCAPFGIADLGGLSCRVDDVREHDRRQNPVWGGERLARRQKGSSTVLKVLGSG